MTSFFCSFVRQSIRQAVYGPSITVEDLSRYPNQVNELDPNNKQHQNLILSLRPEEGYELVSKLMLRSVNWVDFLIKNVDKNSCLISKGFKEALKTDSSLLEHINMENVDQAIMLIEGFSAGNFKTLFLRSDEWPKFLIDHADKCSYEISRGFEAALEEKPELINLIDLENTAQTTRLITGFSADSIKVLFLRSDKWPKFLIDHADKCSYAISTGFAKALEKKPRLRELLNPNNLSHQKMIKMAVKGNIPLILRFLRSGFKDTVIEGIRDERDFIIANEDLFKNLKLLQELGDVIGWRVFSHILAHDGISQERFSSVREGDYKGLIKLYNEVLQLSENILAVRGNYREEVVPTELRTKLLGNLKEEDHAKEAQKIITKLERLLIEGQTELTAKDFARIRMIADAMYDGSVNSERNYGLDKRHPITFTDKFPAEQKDHLKPYGANLLTLMKLLDDDVELPKFNKLTRDEKINVLKELAHAFDSCSPTWVEGITAQLIEVLNKRDKVTEYSEEERIKYHFHTEFVEQALIEANNHYVHPIYNGVWQGHVHTRNAVLNKYGSQLGFTDKELQEAREDAHSHKDFNVEAVPAIYENLKKIVTPRAIMNYVKEWIAREEFSMEMSKLLYQACMRLEDNGIVLYEREDLKKPDGEYEYGEASQWVASFYDRKVKDMDKMPEELLIEFCRGIGLFKDAIESTDAPEASSDVEMDGGAASGSEVPVLSRFNRGLGGALRAHPAKRARDDDADQPDQDRRRTRLA